ncbi:helix-turn-helix transcriptional regulator [Thiolapillus sp.]|uniref:helix-turn-helix transcriptional regulator n=1 Tax=Thiolapillus sp. TaxID=2017437 RepID=UPI003AF47DAD
MSKRNRRKEKKAQKTAAMKYQEIEEREQKMEEERRATTARLRKETMERNGTNKRPRPKPITPEIQWLTTKETEALAQISRTTMHNARKAGTFPEPIKIGKKCLWIESEIKEWMNNKNNNEHEQNINMDYKN